MIINRYKFKYCYLFNLVIEEIVIEKYFTIKTEPVITLFLLLLILVTK